MFRQDSLVMKSFSFGDFVLRSKVYPEAENIINDSCSGQITGNVFFGKAGVGKSTVASLVSSKPGLFDVGTDSQGTTTLGLVFSKVSPLNFVGWYPKCQNSKNRERERENRNSWH